MAADANDVGVGILVQHGCAVLADCIEVVDLECVMVEKPDTCAVDEQVVVVGFDTAERCIGTDELITDAESESVEVERSRPLDLW